VGPESAAQVVLLTREVVDDLEEYGTDRAESLAPGHHGRRITPEDRGV